MIYKIIKLSNYLIYLCFPVIFLSNFGGSNISGSLSHSDSLIRSKSSWYLISTNRIEIYGSNQGRLWNRATRAHAQSHTFLWGPKLEKIIDYMLFYIILYEDLLMFTQLVQRIMHFIFPLQVTGLSPWVVNCFATLFF